MEPKEPQFNPEPPAAEEIKIIDGKPYHRVASGYTIREYFSHETESKGPGPGWDTRWDILKQYGVDEPSELPNEPYYTWVPVRTGELVRKELMQTERRIMNLKIHHGSQAEIDDLHALQTELLAELQALENKEGKI